MPIVYDPVNKNAASGTEQMLRGLEARADSALLQPFSIGRAIMLFDPNSHKVYWTHNIPPQMGIREVSEQKALHIDNRWKYVDNIVFVSDWQKQRYNEYFKFSEADQKRFTVLRNAITPIAPHTKPTDKIRLIYMSVPERGLAMLYDVFEKIAPKYNIELEVFSSYKIYGIPNADQVHRRVLDKVKAHPKIKYHGTVSNQQIHQALQRAHIFAYPSTFLETSCMSLIEAMSAGCICVHPDLAALPETAAGYTNMYEFNKNRAIHAEVFQAALEKAISQVGRDMSTQQSYVNNLYSWDTRIQEWNTYLKGLL